MTSLGDEPRQSQAAFDRSGRLKAEWSNEELNGQANFT
jgi:hypothetical protein